jgi:predicted acetyltransferase
MNQPDDLSLVVPTIEYADEYLAMVDDFIAIGEGYPFNNIGLARQDFAAFVQELKDEAAGIGLPPGIPPQQTYFSVIDGGTVVGEIRFRPQLQPPFERYNGHVGYNIRPGYRRKGYATRQLALVIDKAREAGLTGCMIPIAGDNRGSIRTAEKSDGKLVKQFDDPETGECISCYWIAL